MTKTRTIEQKECCDCSKWFEKTLTLDGAENIRCPACRKRRVKEEMEKNKRNYSKNAKKAGGSLFSDTEK